MRHRPRVLIQNRPDAFKRPGGDTVQMLHTRDGLRRLGIPADISLSSQPNLAEYSLVHLFHCTFPHTARQQANAVRQDVPYVLSPIAVDYGRYYFYQTSGPRKRALRRLGGLGLTVFRRKLDRDARRSRAGRRAKRVLDGAAVLLPNSEHEQSFIRRRFRPDSPSVAIKIAPDTRHGTGRAERFRRRWAIDDFVLSVGRIEPQKNQLTLIRALAGSGRPLFLAGRPGVGSQAYVRSCRDAAVAAGVELHIQELPERQLADAYAAAAVHVLPSWAETTGLVTLEAALAGCRVVATTESPASEYFGELIDYCEPNSVRSMRTAIERSARQRASGIRSRARRYTWERSARQTVQAYRLALSEPKGRGR